MSSELSPNKALLLQHDLYQILGGPLNPIEEGAHESREDLMTALPTDENYHARLMSGQTSRHSSAEQIMMFSPE